MSTRSERPGRRKGKSGGAGKGNQGNRSQGHGRGAAVNGQPVFRNAVEIGRLSRRAGRELRVEVVTADRATYVNVREWTVPRHGEGRPTNMGVAIPRTLARRFARLLDQAADVIEDRPSAALALENAGDGKDAS